MSPCASSGLAATNDNSKDLKLRAILRSADGRRAGRGAEPSHGEGAEALTAWLKATLTADVQLAAKLLAEGKDDVSVLEASLARAAQCARALLATGRAGDSDLWMDGSAAGGGSAPAAAAGAGAVTSDLRAKMDATAVVIPFLRKKGQGNSMVTFRDRYPPPAPPPPLLPPRCLSLTHRLLPRASPSAATCA